MTRTICGLLAALCAVLLTPALAAAHPGNDGRDDAQSITQLPAIITGTTSGATAESGESSSPCAADDGSVWYRYDPKRSRRVLARLQAGGDLDATVTVYARFRSQQTFETCDLSDTTGRAAVAFDVRANQSYLIRVAQRADSVSGNFTLRIVRAPRQQATLPLPAGGVSGALDRLARTKESWAVHLTAGVRYRVALVQPRRQCVTATLYAPATRHTLVVPKAHLTCMSRYTLVAPRAGHSGTYKIVVNARFDIRGPQRYHLQLARAGGDDTAPGVLVPNDAAVTGALDGGGIDMVDLYRFNVTDDSRLYLHLRTRANHHFDLALLDQGGRQLQCVCGSQGSQFLIRTLRPGRYFIALTARGSYAGTYRLLRASRTITDARMALSTHSVAVGQTVTATTTVAPAVSGIVTFVFEQHDPLAGWLFVAARHVRTSNGVAATTFTAPSVGRWRVRATYDGTAISAPSVTGYDAISVQEPLD